MAHINDPQNQKTPGQIQLEIEKNKTTLDHLERTLIQEPWNNEAQQAFRSTQARLNNLLAERAGVK